MSTSVATPARTTPARITTAGAAAAPAAPDLRGRTVLVMHAHPDDESIFSGITLRRLAEAGARTVLVLATAGDLGGSRVPLRLGETVAQRRVAEAEAAAAILGVARVVPLGGRDSGLPGGPGLAHPDALAAADPMGLARTVARIAEAENADTLVHDDDGGIYGHPDHRVTGQVGALAAQLTGATAYRTTVDRDHLHRTVPGGHLVHGAAAAAGVEHGRAAQEIALAITGSAAHRDDKRAAILAHASQVGPADVPGADRFAAVYGREWYRRSGPPGVLDALVTSS